MSAPPNLSDRLKDPLKAAVDACIADPTFLNNPDMSFLKTFVEQFGGKVPNSSPSEEKFEFKARPAESETQPTAQKEPESNLDLDMSGVIEPDSDAPQKMGNPTLQPTEDEIAQSQAKRSEAVSAFAEKDYEKAIQLYTEAINLNPQASLLYAKRGQVYLLQQKPNACIRDCNRALELNPDSAAAHKFRGRANHLLGNWEEAATDLRLACKFDFDEQTDEWLREVTPNARKIEEHKRKKERSSQEKVESERREKIQKAKDAAKAHEESTRTSQSNKGSDDVFEMGDIHQFLNDPELLQAFRDPEISDAFGKISSNPANILKYQSNPKVMTVINLVAAKFAGAVGGMSNFPGTSATPNTENRQPAPPPPLGDFDLD